MNDKVKVKKDSLVRRLLDTFVWVPIIVLAIFVFSDYNHLVLNIMAVLASVIGGYELGKMFQYDNDRNHSFLLYPLMGGLIPALTLASLYLPGVDRYFMAILTLSMLVVMTQQVLIIDEFELNNAIARVTKMIFALFYPGFFLSYFIRLSQLSLDDNSSNILYAFFFFLIFMNDSMAYFWGRLWGDKTHSKGFVLVSTSKSLIGFAGGLLSAIVVAIIFYKMPGSEAYFKNKTLIYAIIMGFVCGVATIIGDLFESTLKRSAGVKDSGNFFKGRGGMLDVCDSILFTVPLFYYFLYFA